MGALLRHKGVLVAIVIIVIAGIWWGLSQPPATSSSVIATVDASGAPVTGASTGAPGGGSSGLVETLLALRTVTLSGSIFSDPAFQNLKDFSVAIVPEPVGRPDPFAPLGVSASVSGSAVHVSNIFKKSGQ